MTDDLSSPNRPVHLLARSQSSTFQISLTRVFPTYFRSSSLPFPWYISALNTFLSMCSPSFLSTCPYQFNLLSVIFLEACATLVVPRMCSFLILYLRVTPHIHRSILISVTSNLSVFLLFPLSGVRCCLQLFHRLICYSAQPSSVSCLLLPVSLLSCLLHISLNTVLPSQH